MKNQTLRALVFDEENKLVDLDGKVVDASPLGVPIPMTLPKPTSRNQEDNFNSHGLPTYFNLEETISKIRDRPALYVDNRPQGNIGDADSYVFGFTGASVDAGDLIRGGLPRERKDYVEFLLGAVQFYKTR